MAIDAWQLATSFVVGCLIGTVYFGGLWLTVKHIPTSDNPHLLLVGSFFLRMAVALATFYTLVPWGWQALAVALLGLLISRQVLTRINGRKPNNRETMTTNR